MGKTAVGIDLTDSERRELESLASRRKTAQGLAQRARIVLHAAEGVANKDISLRLGAAPNTVGKWRRRFAEHRMAGLYDEPRPGAPRQIGDDEVAEVVRQTLEATPPDATHWSLRSMAKAAGFAPSTIHRIWRAFNLQPHRTETFKLSTDPLSSRRCAISSGFICRRRSARWFFALTKRARSRRWTERSRFCRCARARSSGAPTTMRVTEPLACSLLSTPPPARSWGAAIPVIADASS